MNKIAIVLSKDFFIKKKRESLLSSHRLYMCSEAFKKSFHFCFCGSLRIGSFQIILWVNFGI